ncbi:MAG: cell wall metabolism sensor histidine kinase WalK [Firmicutes bacterium]|nr:cell wall metabolism sensor histidine kinase WalK [Bacillota bacterium]
MAGFARKALQEQVEADLLSDARLLRLVWQETLDYKGLGAAEKEQRIIALSRESGRMLKIIDNEGRIVVDTVEPAKAGSLRLLTVSLPLENQGLLLVASESELIPDLMGGLTRRSALIALLVVSVSLLIAYFQNRAITEPIQDLLVVVRRLQKREFGRKVLVRSSDDIGQLGRAFNKLSETLEELFFKISDREGKLNAILSSMDDGVLAVNMGRKVILANKAVFDLFAVEPEEIIGKNQFEATHNEDLSWLLEETMDTKQSLTREVRLRRGSERILAVTSSFLEDEEGDGLGAVAVLRDITSLRHLEQMRQEFVANVSHELRTPLTSIKGFVETILNGNLDDKKLLERFLTIINNETDRMIVLINDLLDLSRIEGGKQPFNKAAVDMKKIFDDTMLILQNKAKDKNITLENNIYSPVVVEGDEELLRQVAINLVDNGIKYTPEGGRVWVEAEQGLESVEFLINDNGVGIPREHLERIFERFYRVDKGRARYLGGTGLGLAITKHIVDKHKGTICAESRIGKGTKMRLTLNKAN